MNAKFMLLVVALIFLTVIACVFPTINVGVF